MGVTISVDMSAARWLQSGLDGGALVSVPVLRLVADVKVILFLSVGVWYLVAVRKAFPARCEREQRLESYGITALYSRHRDLSGCWSKGGLPHDRVDAGW